MPCPRITSLHLILPYEELPQEVCQCPMSGSRLCTLIEEGSGIFSTIVCQCPMSGSRLCTVIDGKMEFPEVPECQCPMSGSRLCTLPPKNPSVYAGFRPCFFMYLSELSDFWVQLCQKVGKAQIVFFKAQFKDVHFIYYTSNERVRNMNATGFHCIRLLKMSLKRMR